MGVFPSVSISTSLIPGTTSDSIFLASVRRPNVTAVEYRSCSGCFRPLDGTSSKRSSLMPGNGKMPALRSTSYSLRPLNVVEVVTECGGIVETVVVVVQEIENSVLSLDCLPESSQVRCDG